MYAKNVKFNGRTESGATEKTFQNLRELPVYSCKEHSADFSGLAGVGDVSTEKCQVFPRSFCNSCHSKMKRAKNAGNDGHPFHSITAVEWSHTRRAAKWVENHSIFFTLRF